MVIDNFLEQVKYCGCAVVVADTNTSDITGFAINKTVYDHLEPDEAWDAIRVTSIVK
jgi:hypothetical protein